MEDGESADRGGHATSLGHFVILVVGIFVHGTSSLQIARLAGNGGGVLLELFTTIRDSGIQEIFKRFSRDFQEIFKRFSRDSQEIFGKIKKHLRGKLIDNNGEFDVNFKSFRRPLIGDGHVVNISTDETIV